MARTGGTGYLGGMDGKLYALDLDTGALKWSHHLGAPINTSPAVYRVYQHV